MKCRYCGHDIPDGILYCEQCGKEVRIVPDYNPLDDVLAAQIKGSIDGTERPLDDYEYVRPSVSSRRKNTNPGIKDGIRILDRERQHRYSEGTPVQKNVPIPDA